MFRLLATHFVGVDRTTFEQDLQEKNKHFSVERSFLMSPDRIERMARRELGLVDPSPADVRRVAVIDGHINEVQARADLPDGDRAGVDAAAPDGSRTRTAGLSGARTAARTGRKPGDAAGGAAGTGEGVIEAGLGVFPAAGTATPRRRDDTDEP